MKHPRPSCPTHRCPEHCDQREILLEEATPAFLRRLADEIEEQQRRKGATDRTSTDMGEICISLLLCMLVVVVAFVWVFR